MNRTIDVGTVRTEMRKLAKSKPVYAAAGAGVLATRTLRELPARLAKWRSEGAVTSLPGRATEYVHSARAKAVSEYDKLAAHGKRVINGQSTARSRSALNSKSKQH